MLQQEVLEVFKVQYSSFCQSLAQTQLLATIASHSLGDFPRRLPSDLREPLAVAFRELAGKFNEAANSWEGNSVTDLNVTLDLSQLNIHGATSQTFTSLSIEWLLSSDFINSARTFENAGSQFHAAACHQAVAMLIAHLDGFLSDSVRAICLAQPSILKSKRKATWEELLEFKTIEELRRHLVSEYVEEFGRSGVLVRLERLQNEVGLKLNLPEEDSTTLQLYEKRRHLIIHNAGIATSSYLSESKDPSAEVGKLLAISEDDVQELAGTVKNIGGTVFTSIVYKFFKENQVQLPFVWRRNKAK